MGEISFFGLSRSETPVCLDTIPSVLSMSVFCLTLDPKKGVIFEWVKSSFVIFSPDNAEIKLFVSLLKLASIEVPKSF